MKKWPIVLILILGIMVFIYSGTIKRSENKGASLSIQQERTDPSLEAARSYINAGDLVSAERELLKNLDADGLDEQKYYWLSFIYVKSADFAEAFKYAKPLVERTADPKILTDLGSLFAMAGYDEMALVCYSKSLNEDKRYIPAYIELGKLYGNQDKFVQAISVWQDGLRIAPDNQEMKSLIEQANALWQQQDQAQK